MEKLAIITARGGSKRIPRKNIRDFLGKPILVYSIEAALGSGLFQEVMVSTDDPQIAEIALRTGATVPFMRSASAADDHSTTVDVLLDVLGMYARIERHFQLACCLYPTAPFIRASDLQLGCARLLGSGLDSVFPVARFSYPIQRALTLTNGNVSMIWPENERRRSQDLPAAFHDAGQWYWFNVDSFLAQRTLLMRNSGAVEMPATRVQDIDTEEDWAVAELKYKLASLAD